MPRFGLVFLLFLGGCALRGPLALIPDAAMLGSTTPVFVATTRAFDSSGAISTDRASQPAYGRIDVAVPPDRNPGEVRLSGAIPDPKTDFVAVASTSFRTPAAFVAALNNQLLAVDPDEREIVVYVHGFNNTFSEGVARIAQLSNDLRLPGVAAHYSWPSLAHPLGYGYDFNSMLFARNGFEEMLERIDRTAARRIILVGHSLGAFLVMETLRQMSFRDPGSVVRKIDSVVLISPDIDIEVFRSQAEQIGQLPEPFIIFTSERDRVLRLSARLSGASERLGNIPDANAVADLNVTLLNVSDFSNGAGHFTAGTSPALLQILARLREVDAAFQRDPAGRAGLFPGTVLTIQNATEVILSPGGARSQ